MPEIVVILSCHSLRFSINLKYKARTEKSPQPGHQVGWSAAISFLLSGLGPAGAAGAAIPLPDCRGRSTVGELISLGKRVINCCDYNNNKSLFGLRVCAIRRKY